MLVDDDAEVQPVAHQLALVVVGRGTSSCSRRIAGWPPSSSHEVALGAGDRERLADRAAALRHDRTDRDVVGAAAPRPRRSCDDASSSDEAVAARAGRGRRQPADHRELRDLRVARAAGSRAPGTRTDRRAAAACRAAATASGQPTITTPSSVCIGVERDRRRRGPRRSPPRTPTAPGRPRPRRPPPATATAVAADQHLGLEQLAQPAGDVLERADVVRRREAHERGRGARRRTARGSRPRPRRPPRPAIGCSESAAAYRFTRSTLPASTPTGSGLSAITRSRSGSAVSGTVTAEPLSRIVQRASIVPGSGNSSSPCTRRYPNLPGSTKNGWRLRPTSSPASRTKTVSSVPLPSLPAGARTSTTRCGVERAGIRVDGGREERAGDVDAGRRARRPDGSRCPRRTAPRRSPWRAKPSALLGPAPRRTTSPTARARSSASGTTCSRVDDRAAQRADAADALEAGARRSTSSHCTLVKSARDSRCRRTSPARAGAAVKSAS